MNEQKKCDICHERPATIGMKMIVNGVMTTQHICSFCAERLSSLAGGGALPAGPGMFIQAIHSEHLDKLASGIMDLFKQIENNQNDPNKENEEEKETQENVCSSCGRTLEEFRQTDKLGCKDCYDAFREAVEERVKKLHPGKIHKGRIIKNADAYDRRARILREQMRLAAQEENYAEAARLRDMARDLEKKLNKLRNNKDSEL